jgi:hypothetical protein
MAEWHRNYSADAVVPKQGTEKAATQADNVKERGRDTGRMPGQ